jgi:hypothetical protein
MGKLDKADKRETDRCRNEIIDIRSRVLVMKPVHDIKTLGEHLLGLGVLGESLEQLS